MFLLINLFICPQKLFSSIDTDGNGEIDFEEFSEAMGNLSVRPDR